MGTVFGAAFYFPHLAWAASFLGDHPLSWVPWVALASAEALIMGALSPLVTLAYRWSPQHWRYSGRGVLGLISGCDSGRCADHCAAVLDGDGGHVPGRRGAGQRTCCVR